MQRYMQEISFMCQRGFPHQEIESFEAKSHSKWVVVRNTSEPIVVNLPDDFWGEIHTEVKHSHAQG